jgi:hypothetical protein
MVWKNGGHLFSQKSNGHSHAIPQTCFCDYHAVEILRKGAGADTLSQRGGYIFILHGYRNYLMSDKEEIGITDLLLDDRQIIKSLNFFNSSSIFLVSIHKTTIRPPVN